MTPQILLVDDSADTRECYSLILKDEGFAVTAVAGGRECLRLLAERHFDAVLLDYLMPDLTGLDVLRELEHRKARPPVILFSVWDDADVFATAMNLGAVACITKRASQLEQLIATIRRKVPRTE